MANDPYAEFTADLGQTSQADPYAEFTHDLPSVRPTQNVSDIREKIEPGVMGETDPVGQKLLKNASTAVGGMAIGYGIPTAVEGVASLFKASPTLLSAGIKPQTVLKMTPTGQNPAQFGQQLEQGLNKIGAISSDAKQTWNNFNNLTQKAGQRVGASLDSIEKAAGPDAVTVNAGEALQPLVNEWVDRASGALAGTRRLAKPFEEAHQTLVKAAVSKGGVLGLDDIHSLLKEVGPLTHIGSEASQAAYSELYGTLAEVQKSMIQRVAQQAGNPALSNNLLSANADYSKFMSLMPDVSKAASAFPIKQPVSVAGRIAPYIEKGTGLGLGFQAVKKMFGQ